MKTLISTYAITLLLTAATAGVYAADFEDYARVVEVSPQYEEINQPRKECTTEYVPVYRERRSVGGAIIGGITGGLIGSHVGRGNGRVAGAAVGAITGALVGDRIDNDDGRVTERPVRSCRTIDNWQTRVQGYAVTYEYQGHTYTTVLPYDPGDRLRVRISVAPKI
jgi:uncharacterized protein YcfJ